MSQTENAQFSGTGVATEGDSFTAPFPSMGRPDDGTGELTVRLRKTQPDAVTAFIELRQGTTVIASRTVSPTTSFADYSLGLTADDVGQLTTGQCSLSDLTVQVSFAAVTSCCENPLPNMLTAMVTAVSQIRCGCSEGEEIDLNYNGIDWFGSADIQTGAGGGPCTVKNITFRLYCDSGTWKLDIGGCHTSNGNTPDTITCSPFDAVFIVPGLNGCCDAGPHAATFEFTITE